MSKRKVSVEDKTYAVNLYLDGKESQRRIADMFDVSLASVQQWIRNIDYYNNKRLQRDLGILTPMEKHEIYLQAA